jgi:small subunit ribosomal protein S12
MATIHQASNKNRTKKTYTCPTKKLQNCPQKSGVVTKIRVVTPKKPNSARRKIARVRLSTQFIITARIVGQGHNLQAYSRVLVRGGRANDLPGVRYTLIKGSKDFS